MWSLNMRVLSLNNLDFLDTSRQKKGVEAEGEEYVFVSRQEMEKDIQSKRYCLNYVLVDVIIKFYQEWFYDQYYSVINDIYQISVL